MNSKGQTFPALVVVFLAMLIFIFAAPFLSELISVSAAGQGTATSFVMKLFLWVIFITLLAVLYKIISSGEGLFA